MSNYFSLFDFIWHFYTQIFILLASKFYDFCFAFFLVCKFAFKHLVMYYFGNTSIQVLFCAAKKYNEYTLFTAREQLIVGSRRIAHLVNGEHHGMRVLLVVGWLILVPSAVCCLSSAFSIFRFYSFFFAQFLTLARGHWLDSR